jgi:hypothetical protein
MMMEPISNFAFNYNLRRYTEVFAAKQTAETEMATAYAAADAATAELAAFRVNAAAAIAAAEASIATAEDNMEARAILVFY